MKETEAYMTEEEFDELMNAIFNRKDSLDEIQFEPKTKTTIIIDDVVLPSDRIVDFDFSGNADSKYLRVTFIYNPKTDTFNMHPYFDIEDDVEDDLEIHWKDKPNTKAAWEV